VAETKKRVAPARRRRARAQPRKRRLLGRFVPLLVAVVVAYLYYRPITSWLHTRDALAQRTTQVRVLEARKAGLERDVAQATSVSQVIRQARRIGLVRPGERLFIVNGIPAWKQAHAQRAGAAGGR
jgi:hypothetical protein